MDFVQILSDGTLSRVVVLGCIIFDFSQKFDVLRIFFECRKVCRADIRNYSADFVEILGAGTSGSVGGFRCNICNFLTKIGFFCFVFANFWIFKKILCRRYVGNHLAQFVHIVGECA